MRILFDQSSHDMRNKGNNALLESAMHRLGKFWTNASLEVITLAPNLLKLYYPNAIPVNPYDLQRVHNRYGQYQRFIPRSVWWLLFELREEAWHRRYEGTKDRRKESMQALFDGRNNQSPGIVQYGLNKADLQTALSQFDLFVASGGGYMCDSDKPMVWNVFDRLEASITAGIPTIMVGQGIGPMKDPELLARAREILPSVRLILYRNRRNGLPLLESLGVIPERILMTGDDAIEMAYEARADEIGDGIGVSLRVAHYTQVESSHLYTVRRVLHQLAAMHQAELIAVPISSAHHESDITHIRQILKGYDRTFMNWRKLGTPMDAIRLAGKCRVMITGTYHGAIFSLAQGIPVVGIARSVEYINKLSELSDEFSTGVQIVHLNDSQLETKLRKAIEDAWSSAEKVRHSVLTDAVRLIDMQHLAYQRVYEVVNQNNGK